MYKSKEELVKMMKMLYGLEPYIFSLCRGDGYFHNDLKREIDKSKYTWYEIEKESLKK